MPKTELQMQSYAMMNIAKIRFEGKLGQPLGFLKTRSGGAASEVRRRELELAGDGWVSPES